MRLLIHIAGLVIVFLITSAFVFAAVASVYWMFWNGLFITVFNVPAVSWLQCLVFLIVANVFFAGIFVLHGFKNIKNGE